MYVTKLKPYSFTISFQLSSLIWWPRGSNEYTIPSWGSITVRIQWNLIIYKHILDTIKCEKILAYEFRWRIKLPTYPTLHGTIASWFGDTPSSPWNKASTRSSHVVVDRCDTPNGFTNWNPLGILFAFVILYKCLIIKKPFVIFKWHMECKTNSEWGMMLTIYTLLCISLKLTPIHKSELCLQDVSKTQSDA